MGNSCNRNGLVIAALLVLVCTGCSSSERSESPTVSSAAPNELGSSRVPPPSTISALVADRDAIVVASVSLPGTERIVVHPTPLNATPPDPSEGLDYMNEPVTDYVATCSDSLLGSISQGQAFTLRLNGQVSQVPTSVDVSSLGYPVSGRSYLIFLFDNQDEAPGPSFSPKWGANDLIFVDQSSVTYADGELVPFATGMTGAEFVNAVRDAVDELY